MRPSIVALSQDLIQALIKTKISVPSAVSEVAVNYSARGPGQAGARHFIREYLPALKFHNPNVQFKVARTLELKDPSISLKFGDGTQRDVVVANRFSQDIVKLFTEGEIPPYQAPAPKPKRTVVAAPKGASSNSRDAAKKGSGKAVRPEKPRKKEGAEGADKAE